MKKEQGEKIKRVGEIKSVGEVIADKFNIFAIICFLLSIFLLDVNANIISSDGIDTKVSFFGETKFQSTSAFWTGIIGASLFFFLVAIRSFYLKKEKHTKLDLFVAVFGVIGLMIILSGGLLMFWHSSELIIPFFTLDITRGTYYHTGIVIEIFCILYFALTK